MLIYQVSVFGKVGVHGYNQVKKHKTNVPLHSRFSECVYFVTDRRQYNLGANHSFAINKTLYFSNMRYVCLSELWAKFFIFIYNFF